MEFLSSDKILIIDLAAAEISEEELSEDLVAEKISGAGVCKHLYEQYADEDPVVIGTGLLTGTMFPASAAGVVAAKSPRSGKLCFAPITLKVAIEIKYAGFDYLVIKGASDKPVYLWLHDGVADLNDASQVWGKDTWQTTDIWRQELGEDVIQTLCIGAAGESGNDFAQIVLNYWASGDRFGLGKCFGQKNLKGVALRGMGLLEVADPEAFVDRSLELFDALKQSASAKDHGIAGICAAMGHADVQDWLKTLVHRHTACYNTPLATSTFVFLDEDPQKKEEPANTEPGFLITDPGALLQMKSLGLDAESACRLLKSCAKLGLDPYAAAKIAADQGQSSLEAIEKDLPSLSGDLEMPGSGVFSPWCPPQPLADFGSVQNQEEWWENRQALCLIFGIHPIYALLAPELNAENMLELTNLGTEMDLEQETLDSVISYIRS
jgi:aldehyde:ferredoxin oxidoreductase